MSIRHEVEFDAQAAAIAEARQALAQTPRDPDAWHRLGWAHESRGELEEAVDSYRRAVQFNPDADGSHNNIGNCLNALGRFEEAYAAWRAAIRIAPGCTMYYRNLVQSSPLAPDDPCFVSLENQIAEAGKLPPNAQADLFFAYGQALAGQGEHERAFAQIVRANALYRRCITYKEDEMLGVSTHIPKLFTQALLRERRGSGDPSESPVFVVGMPRSGTSLVEQILASHPQIGGAGERTDFSEALARSFSGGDTNRADALSLEQLSEATPEQFRALGAEYLRRMARTGRPKVAGPDSRLVDKYPYNFIHIGFIHLALPNARIIHVRRSPVDTCLSIYSRWFRNVPFGYDLGELGRYYRAYNALMAHWRAVLPEGVLLEIAYEDLVDDLEGEARRLLSHCAVGWDERCLEFHRTERTVTTASAAQVRQPLYRTSVRRWRPDAQMLRPLLDGLGPELSATVQ